MASFAVADTATGVFKGQSSCPWLGFEFGIRVICLRLGLGVRVSELGLGLGLRSQSFRVLGFQG